MLLGHKEHVMSLDVWLKVKDKKQLHTGSGIFIRENGSTKEISRDEWNERFPGREPVIVEQNDETDEVYSGNITHNLTEMASKAGLYECLWRPDENEITKASQLIEPLKAGLFLLKNDPEKFKRFNPPNGWGTYEGLVRFVSDYLKACNTFPNAEVHVWR